MAAIAPQAAEGGTRRVLRRLAAECGTAAVEFIGALPWMIVAALVAWQLLLFGATASSAENAARSGGRAASNGAAAAEAARQSLPTWLRDDSKVHVNGATVRVDVRVPIVAPRWTVSRLTVSRDAVFPP